ncbi:hypothetical protein [Streptomyces arenae]|uniref:hypothetical protein n=1 Tax=Streptomyces arenae TaxID=29301 RepID=UPI0026597B75|nr:hypothetical protein [Streptomyces arenae]MCG7205333.1 hypothetical protein [Streptomyces arenae]
MDLLLRVTLDEVVAVWLGAEAHSDRFGALVGSLLQRDALPAALVTSPDLTDGQANAARLGLLREYRGFDQADTSFESYIGGLPVRDLGWWRVRIDAADVARVHYINWDYWVQATGGTRLAATFASEQPTGPDGQEAFYTALRDAFVAGASVPEIILVDSGPGTRLVVLEGHVRATAMAMAGASLKERTALLGRGEVVAQQWFY